MASEKNNPNRPDNRGGKREGAGRKKLNNILYQRRIPKDFVPKMDEFLNKLKKETIKEL